MRTGSLQFFLSIIPLEVMCSQYVSLLVNAIVIGSNNNNVSHSVLDIVDVCLAA